MAATRLEGSESRSMLVVYHHSGKVRITTTQYEARINLRVLVDW